MSALKKMLDKYRGLDRVALRVGIMGAKTYPDGTPVAFVGYINEYGYKGTVPERTQTIYHSVNQDGSFKKGGQFVKKAAANFARTVTIPAHTIEIPSRSFFRSAISEERANIKNMAASLLSKHDPETALRLVGEHMVGALSDSVQTWSEPPNAKSTIRQKGYNAPLRANDKLLRNSFSYEIEEK